MPATLADSQSDGKVNILIVDDLPEKHLVMGSILDELGQNIVTARSGSEALRLILQMEFAVILLDVNMPDIDGLETAGLIRQYKKTLQTPILFITAYMDELQAIKGYALGAVDYIASPVVPDILRTKVKVFVDLYRMNRQLKQHAVEREALARSEAARFSAEEAIRRADYLSAASQRLSRSLNIDDTIETLADIAVPALGTAVAIVLPDAHHELQCRSLRIQAFNARQRETHVPDTPCKLRPAFVAAVRSAMDSRQIEFHEPGPVWDCAAGGTADDMCAELPLDIEKMAVCPLFAGDQVLGAITLFGKAQDFQQADVALLREIAGRASIAMENARLYSLVREADRRKNEFLAMLAHELRNPLAPIKNAVHIIRGRTVSDPTVIWAIDVVARQADHMSRMVDDLLDVSRIVRGKVTVQMAPLTLSDLFDSAVEASSPFLAARQQQLAIDMPDHPVVMQGDLVRLSQVLSNLLNNASKFSASKAKIALSASLHPAGLSITVKDHGQGIEPEFLPHIFELFAQGDQALDRAQGGLGIGLTLVKYLMELHHGRVEAYSEGKGKGTHISLHFPASVFAGQHSLSGSSPALPAATSVHAKKVLVVDDLQASADTLRVLLELEGCEVRVANDGPAALQLAREFLPDVVILDIGLPGMDGFEVARHLRSQPEHQRTQLIALTGYGEAQSRLRSEQAGFDHHVVKPADIPFLLTLVGQSSAYMQENQPMP